MALKAAGIRIDCPDDIQPEDQMTAVLNTPAAWDLFRAKYAWAIRAGFMPQNVSGMLAWGINQFTGRNVDHFTTQGTLQQMCWLLMHDKPLIMSGKFTESGHFVAVMGFVSKQDKSEIQKMTDIDLNRITAVIVDDPYGNYYSRYKDHRGNDIHFALDLFHELTNASNVDGGKWMHIIGEPE